MQYTLSEPPRTDSEAFDALEGAFSSSEFSQEEAVQVISKALDISEAEALSHLRTLVRGGSITPTAPIAPTGPITRAARPPVEEGETTIGEASQDTLDRIFPIE